MAGVRRRRWVRFPHIPAKVKPRKASVDRRPFYFAFKIPKNPQFYSARHHEPSPRERGAERLGLNLETGENNLAVLVSPERTECGKQQQLLLAIRHKYPFRVNKNFNPPEKSKIWQIIRDHARVGKQDPLV